jgi:segregation and condensation protein B
LENLERHIESLIFTSSEPILVREIKAALEKTFEQTFDRKNINEVVESLIKKYNEGDYSYEIVAISGGYKFMTKAAYHNTIGNHIKIQNRKNLSKAAMETLSIIAYKQPIPKSEMEVIRGVSCDYSVQKLLEKELVEIIGRSEGPGRPLLYGTSEKFMDYFGLRSIDDLPKLKEFDTEVSGEHSPDKFINKSKSEEE